MKVTYRVVGGRVAFCAYRDPCCVFRCLRVYLFTCLPVYLFPYLLVFLIQKPCGGAFAFVEAVFAGEESQAAG